MIDQPVEKTEEERSREAFERFVRGVRWPLVVLGLLAIHHTMMLVGLTTALGMPGFHAVAHEAERGIEWDSLQSLRRGAAELGWRLEVSVSDQPELNGDHQAVLRLTNDQKSPLPGVAVVAHAYHHARPDESVRTEAITDDRGEWTAPLPIRGHGIWRIDVEAAIDGKRCLIDGDVWLKAGSPPQQVLRVPNRGEPR